MCQTCLAKGLAKHALQKGFCFANKRALSHGFLLCNQECLVKGLAAAQLLHIYIYFNLPSKWNGKKVLDSVHAQVSGLFGSEAQLA